jgi:hypothetical protein
MHTQLRNKQTAASYLIHRYSALKDSTATACDLPRAQLTALIELLYHVHFSFQKLVAPPGGTYAP